ncbi:MAG: sigma-70 family RNA polymerase sigma factor [Bacteroidota bacterium]
MKLEIQQIISQYQSKVYRTCLGFIGDEEEVKDVLQEVWINIWKGLKTFRGDAELSTWIYRITVNTCLLHIRTQKHSPETTLQEVPEMATETLENQEEVTARQVALLRNFLSELPEKDRLIMILYLEESSYQQISEVLGVSVNYVGVKINRIKKSISQKFKYYGQSKANLD